MNASRMFAAVFAAGAVAMASAASAHEVITGSGKQVTQQRTVSGFNGVSLAVPARIEIVQGDREGVELTGDDNVLAEIETVVDQGSLKLRWRKDVSVRNAGTLRGTVYARTVEAIAISGSGDVHAPALQSKQLALRIAGSGDMNLAGRADAVQVRISGSGNVKAAKLDARQAKVNIAGSGDATLWARESLSVTVAGSGDVRYYGDPSVEKRIAGSGSVRRAGASPG